VAASGLPGLETTGLGALSVAPGVARPVDAGEPAGGFGTGGFAAEAPLPSPVPVAVPGAFFFSTAGCGFAVPLCAEVALTLAAPEFARPAAGLPCTAPPPICVGGGDGDLGVVDCAFGVSGPEGKFGLVPFGVAAEFGF